MYAFERAAALGVDALELDIHGTADGTLVVMHDDRVERLTDGSGEIRLKTLAELKKLDAGYWWTQDGGQTYPYRGQGITIPTLEEVLVAFPGLRLNIDIKQEHPSIVEPFARLLEAYGRLEDVMVGSFHETQLSQFRQRCPTVATAAGALEVRLFYLLTRLHLDAAFPPRADAFQIPERYGDLQLITPHLIRAAHAHNMAVHVWTVDEAEDMRRLLAWGVDGIMTDYPERLLDFVD
jgi:glycerophosphoryl diester phosphodiesterase